MERTRAVAVTALGATLGLAPGVALVLVSHFLDRDVAAPALLLPIGYVGGIWLTLTQKRYVRGGWTAAVSVAGFVAGVALVNSTDWWQGTANTNWIGGPILGGLAFVAALVAGALVPALAPETDVDSERRSSAELVGSAVAGAVGWGSIGVVAGFGVGLAGLAVTGMGDFGAGAIVLGVAAAGGLVGSVVGIGIAGRKSSD